MADRLRFLFLVCLALAPLSARAETLAREQVPAPLVPWIDWALHGAEDSTCPPVHGDAERHECAWPSLLSLDLTASGGRFEQQWRVYRRVWVPLPGDAHVWPQDVTVNGAPALVAPRGDVPSVQLEPGLHRIAGRFELAELPDSLAIPRQTGLVSLTRLGERVVSPDRDGSGRLWLRRQREETEGGTRLDVIVHRRVIDEVPLLLETLIELEVAGPAREVLLGRALLSEFVAMSLVAPLPVRLEPDGRLRVQVRPGTWHVQVLARRAGGPVEEIAFDKPGETGKTSEAGEPGGSNEVWVFDARNHLRVVDVQGVPGVDPQQTRLPDAWRQLPAYLMEHGSRMHFSERRRGDSDPAPDQLSLARTWWLDFDGGGYTVHDRVEGTLSRSWRLDVAAPMELGRVAIDGRDQFLSRLDDSSPAGVEVRQGGLNLEADSRMDAVRSVIPATGWRHDFQQVSGQLNLPPGWRLFHASGVDDIRTTWIRQWSLLDIFLVLVTTMIVAQLFGLLWGGVAFAGLVLSYPEPGAPRYVWLTVLAAHALLRVMPLGRFQQSMRLARIGALVALVLVAVPFLVQQARVAFYPALEFPRVSIDGEQAKLAGFALGMASEDEARGEPGIELKASRAPESSVLRSRMVASEQLADYYTPDPAARVSTGPGLPHWAWRTLQLSWRGPVDESQQLRLWLLPPWVNFVLAWLRIGLIAALLVCLFGVGELRRLWPRRLGGVAPLLLVALLGGGAATARADDFPAPELLEELRMRLLAPPECAPACAASPRMRLSVGAGLLRARIEVDAVTATAVPLPGGLKAWVPETVTLDGAPADALSHGADGHLWISLSPGKHQILLEGPLPDRDSVSLPLPLRPHRVVIERLVGWTLDGVRESGEPEGSLQLSRKRSAGSGLSTLEAQDLPSFVEVSRTLRLGLAWQVETSVRRATPLGRALFVEIPLLAGESVTSEAIQVKDGRALVRMRPDANVVSWTSVLGVSDAIVLQAPAELGWTEVWRLDVSPIWHVDVEGIPPVHQAETAPIRLREWRPWPGEQVAFTISRPGAIEGRTLTIDRVELSARPGLRTSENTLVLSLRSSRGGQHAVALPANAELQSVKIDQVAQPIRADDGRVTLPIRPGKHSAELVWRLPVPISLRYATPALDPGGPSVNSEIRIDVPADRWILLVGGPRLGPAILFWSVLVIALLASIGLGVLPLTPLGVGSWFLLLVGMTQVPLPASLFVVGWLLVLGWRRDNGQSASSALAFDAMQVLLALWTLVALCLLIWAVQQGLLGLPDMQIRGNGSSGPLLRWYHDRSDEGIPTAWMLSLPLYAYRLAMLAWALWLARALVSWLRWGWQCYSAGELWRPVRRATPAQR